MKLLRLILRSSKHQCFTLERPVINSVLYFGDGQKFFIAASLPQFTPPFSGARFIVKSTGRFYHLL
jgi:hypothetical protein